MKRLILLLLFISPSTALVAQELHDNMFDSVFIDLKITAAIIVLNLILIFLYLINRKRTFARLLYAVGAAVIIYAIIALSTSDDSSIFLLPSIVSLIVGTLSATMPLLKPIKSTSDNKTSN
jgi:peptidoglycan/LPS O-acetylase OafA/YrhL